MNKYFILLLIFFTSHAALADQGISDTEILIGMHTDLSGPASMIGKQSVDGANMRFDEFNAKGGAHGRLIKFIVEDHQYTCLLYTSPSPRDMRRSRMPSSA